MIALDRRCDPTLKLRHLRFTVIHRLSLANRARGNPRPVPDAELTGADVVERFRDPLLGTGGMTPYHVLIRHDGTVEQLLRLSVRGQHMTDVRASPRWYNWRTLAIAVVGNTDEGPPTVEQYGALIRVVRDLMPLTRGAVGGHTDYPGASSDPHKRCPGKFLDPLGVRDSAARMLPDGWRQWGKQEAREFAAHRGWEF